MIKIINNKLHSEAFKLLVLNKVPYSSFTRVCISNLCVEMFFLKI